MPLRLWEDTDMHPRVTAVQLGLPAVLVLAAGLGVASAQARSQDSRTTVWDGVYTADQAARGGAVYDRHCSSCHLADLGGSAEARPLAGDPFMEDWREDTLQTLFTRIRSLMPFDDPATLSDDAYLDTVAYILQFNGFPAGRLELTVDGLADVQIEGREGPGQVPSFALVQVIGCLTQGADDSWILTSSAAAVRTRDPSGSNADELRALEARSLGTQTFTLMSVYPDPALHTGHKMEAKGFLIRGPDGDRINVSALEMVATACELRAAPVSPPPPGGGPG